MTTLESLLDALDEHTIAREITNRHEAARNRFVLNKNTVASFEEFTDTITAYYSHQYTACICPGGRLSRIHAASAAKDLIEQAYRRRHGTLTSAYHDASTGINNGLRGVIEAISEGIKNMEIEYYVRDVFDRHVAPHKFEDRVAIMREFIQSCGATLPRDMQGQPPERYAKEFQEILRAHVAAIAQVGSTARRS